jgi:hypothetical protein
MLKTLKFNQNSLNLIISLYKSITDRWKNAEECGSIININKIY